MTCGSRAVVSPMETKPQKNSGNPLDALAALEKLSPWATLPVSPGKIFASTRPGDCSDTIDKADLIGIPAPKRKDSFLQKTDNSLKGVLAVYLGLNSDLISLCHMGTEGESWAPNRGCKGLGTIGMVKTFNSR